MWLLFACVGVLGGAAMSIGQQRMKADTIPMLFWLRLTSLVAILPLVILREMPTDFGFYILSALIGVLIVALDIANFKYIAELGAAVAVRLATICSIPAFLLWVSVDHTTRILYIEHPMQTTIIVCIVGIAAYLATHLRRCAVTMTAIRRLWPVMLFATISPTFAKLVVTNQPDVLGGIVAYLIVVCIISMASLAVYMIWNQSRFQSSFAAPKTIKSGIILAACSVMMILCSYLAYWQVYNPAYVSVVFLTSPVIVSFYNRLTGYPDDSNKVAGFGLIACAVALAVVKL